MTRRAFENVAAAVLATVAAWMVGRALGARLAAVAGAWLGTPPRW